MKYSSFDGSDTSWVRHISDITTFIPMEPDIDIFFYNEDNLETLLAWTSKDESFDKWFSSFSQYEQYVKADNYKFRLFRDGVCVNVAYPGDILIRIKGEVKVYSPR